MSAATILIVEDEEHIATSLAGVLSDEGYNVFTAGTLKEGLVEAATRSPDLVVLDLALPDGDGLVILKEIRAYSMLPVIVLSARINEEQKVQALDMGADDYLTKPFGISELLVRVRVQLRRKQDAADRENESIIKLGKDVEVDTERKVVTKGGELVHLTKLELRLLLVMLSEPEKVLTQRYIVQKVWGSEYIEHPHYLRIYMGRLRNKIEDDPSNPSILLTESGVGYRLALKPQAS
ncbi:response regulator [Anaerobiospirillum succiniciproducens]|mgnify:FL=1|uniref:response regulator n=1 Tax=Anaerobiospirillum succiniciproducens TaxID=13335 RepID=UPI00042127DE|nr:response regulator [Anaerobiospirillum succiniciproducens]MCI6864377.1 response regulator [Anaerobiospirillum succiniciproducens]